MQNLRPDNHFSNSRQWIARTNSMELINGDRRNDRRYTIELSLEYRTTGPGSRSECGSGTSIDIGRGGISFEGQHDLRAGTMAELSMDWPHLLQDRCPLRLIVTGRVVWSHAGRIALKIRRYEFRTHGPRSFQTAPTEAPRLSFVA
jgi:hypothetical protein